MNTEYVRNLHSNYERLKLDKKPEENRYQYCILSRGGIKGLLPCSLRYLNDEAYLYYDITSKQNIVQYHHKEYISRDWMLDFMENMHQLQRELGRFLLQEENILWEPQHIYQELESNVFSFLYVPYYDGRNEFLQLLEFFVEKVDYKDEGLVECVYVMYEQLERYGTAYLQEQIFKDVKVLEGNGEYTIEEKKRTIDTETEEVPFSEEDQGERKNRFWSSFFENRKEKKTRMQEDREEYRKVMRMELEGISVAEESIYGEEYGRTAFMPEQPEKKETLHCLYYADGRVASSLETSNLLIGKHRDKVDLYLDHVSVSRMHARVLKDQEEAYLEDSNSTNGTYCNKTRLQPYERRKLKPGDEIRLGEVVLFYR